MKIVDIAKTIAPEAQQKIIGIRPGEKIHEQMISYEDAPHTYEYPDHYKILPSINNWDHDLKRISGGKLVATGFTYCSDNNVDWMSRENLQYWLKKNQHKILKF